MAAPTIPKIADGFLLTAVFVMPPLGVLAHQGLAPLAAVMSLAAIMSLSQRTWHFPWSLRLLTVPALIALAWAAMSALWAVDPGTTLSRAAKLAAATGFGVVILVGVVNLPPATRFRLGIALCAGLALAIVIVAIDLSLMGGLRRAIRNDPSYYGRASLNNGLTWIVLLVWPAGLWLWHLAARTGRRWWRLAAFVPIAACVPLLLNLESQSSLTAFAIGLATFVAVAALPRAVPIALAACIVLGTVTAPLVAPAVFRAASTADWFSTMPSTMMHRAYIWAFTADKIAEKPLLGWGLDSSRAIPGGEAMVTDVNPNLPVEVYGKMQLMPLHPHNAPLQLWLELGVPGALLFAVVTGALLVAVALRIRDRLAAATAATVLLVAIALSSFSYGIWQTWWLAALWLIATLTGMLMRPSIDTDTDERAPGHPLRA